MKIVKRKRVDLAKTMNIWFIPTMSYLLQKLSGVIIPNMEWIWWVGISFTVLVWLGINFKIVKNK